MRLYTLKILRNDGAGLFRFNQSVEGEKVTIPNLNWSMILVFTPRLWISFLMIISVGIPMTTRLMWIS